MGYSKYRSLRQVSKKFGLQVRRTNLTNNAQAIQPSEWLKTTLALASTMPISNEKAKSERLISPILVEVAQLHKDKLTLFSGEELNVKPEDDLNGACDFFFSAIPDAYLLEAPIITLTEAKDEDLDYGIAQCTAQMIGAQVFNEEAGQPTPVIWGCATTAGEWKFLKLDHKVLYVDNSNYYVSKVDELLGIFHQIFETY